MPAPSFLRGLPKPVLFGLYGAIGGLLGALLFAEPAWRLLEPPPPPPVPPPEPLVAVTASPEVEVKTDGRNTFQVQVARAGFDGPVVVRFDNLPTGVTINSVTIPSGATDAEATVVAGPRAVPVATKVKVVAEGQANGAKPTAEAAMGVLVSDPSRPQADVVFVLDVTGSMGWAINGVRDGIRRFAADLSANRIDFRVGLVAFRDLTDPGDAALGQMVVLRFRGGEPFTADAEEFRTEVSRLGANGGGDEAESSLEAIGEACRLPLRKGATRVFLLITDAPPKVGQAQNVIPAPAAVRDAVAAAADLVRRSEIDAVHLVVQPKDLETYRPLMEAGLLQRGGKYFNLQTVAMGGPAFESLLKDFGRVVTEAAKAKNPEGKPQVAAQAEKPVLGVQGVQSSAQFAKGTEGQLTLAIGLWTGAIAALVCLTLLAGQYHYLRGALPEIGVVLAGLVGGLVVGVVGGAAGQGLFLAAQSAGVESKLLGQLFRVVGWALLGGLAGVGLSLFIPNLKWIHGLAGGAVGGTMGAVGFLAVSAVATDLVGRLVGGLILGFCIGLMVAIVEAAFRRAWLEVRYGTRETITVNLGPEPVKVGGDARACTVWARGAEPLALRYFIRDGQVICEDAPSRTREVVGNGDTREVGNVTVTVRIGSSAAPAGPPPMPRTSAPPRSVSPPRPKPKPEPSELEPLELEPLELEPSPPPLVAVAPPVSPPPVPAPRPAAPPAPTARPPVPTRPPVPVAGARPPAPAPSPPVAVPPQPAPQPPAPAANPPTAARDPNACPGCGRKNPGRPGSRYCMMCDQTY